MSRIKHKTTKNKLKGLEIALLATLSLRIRGRISADLQHIWQASSEVAFIKSQEIVRGKSWSESGGVRVVRPKIRVITRAPPGLGATSFFFKIFCEPTSGCVRRFHLSGYGVNQDLSVNPALCRLKLSPRFASDRPVPAEQGVSSDTAITLFSRSKNPR
jgi:hypothetical protein